ncbi:hypothetical protein F889_02506 [Acinetobacter colistiniresistens]|uniref:Uncharacterized protein n=1 Tax=Acinetobacter colistiniresistens TaxID=280145 RepID=N9R3W6_9GAMM|nr:hypothetical protein F889_02506 [Acinetobacter colistiniresistens]
MLNIQFDHLRNISIQNIIELNTNERVLKQMMCAEKTGGFNLVN